MAAGGREFAMAEIKLEVFVFFIKDITKSFSSQLYDSQKCRQTRRQNPIFLHSALKLCSAVF